MPDAYEELRKDNDRRIALLAREGIAVGGRTVLVRDVFLEHILLRVGGPAALRNCYLAIEKRVAAGLEEAEGQLGQIRLRRAAQVLGVPRAAGDS